MRRMWGKRSKYGISPEIHISATTSISSSAYQRTTTTMQYPVDLSEHVRDTDTANPELNVVSFPSPTLFELQNTGQLCMSLCLVKPYGNIRLDR